MGISGIGGINPGTQGIRQGGGIQWPPALPPQPPSCGQPSSPAPSGDSVQFSPEALACVGQGGPGPGDGKPPLGPPEDPFGLGPVSQEKGSKGGAGKPPLGPPEDPFGLGPVSQENRTPQVQTLVSGIQNW